MVKRILIIDDELYFAKLVKMNLELSGNFKVETALKGREGVKLAVKLKPHLILLDLLMPDIDGFEVLEILKKDPKTARIPVIMLSAKSDEETRIQVLKKKDVKLFITKPIGAEELRGKITKVLEGKAKRN
jgi:DNA-binding response OmpR family regulator